MAVINFEVSQGKIVYNQGAEVMISRAPGTAVTNFELVRVRKVPE